MEFFTKKIFENKIDDSVHIQFQKFSRGEFKDKAMIKIKNSAGKYTIATTAEYAKELIIYMAEKLGNEKTLVKGALVSALDIPNIKFEDKKMAMGVRKYVINREMTGKEILDLCNSLNKVFFGLSFKVGDEDLIIKDKSPKSAKGASSAHKEDKDLKIDFCKLKTVDKKIVEGLIFESDVKDFKTVVVRHNFIISEIVIPTELKNEKDFAIVREKSHRKGKVERIINLDDKIVKKEANFEA